MAVAPWRHGDCPESHSIMALVSAACAVIAPGYSKDHAYPQFHAKPYLVARHDGMPVSGRRKVDVQDDADKERRLIEHPMSDALPGTV